ncbi:COR domain-containing protein [Spirosoma rhododendri]|uniref:non-specific serine/threonine protein kinase n=1 Tax=Spirosoma rhododendri TaxID=2728024 RepID=A0A7L5DVD6_9BACT|nr:COR domain-containing protein [Spirosoma rhododendri]QJD79510.1 hypothetical protein HH216_14660 [Spirosoma rhododendri]
MKTKNFKLEIEAKYGLKFVETITRVDVAQISEDTYQLNEKGDIIGLTVRGRNANSTENLSASNLYEILELLPFLQRLRLNNFISVDLNKIAKLRELTHLNISYNNVTHLEPISTMISLRELHFSNNLVVDIEPICKLKNLRVIHGLENKIENINFLRELKLLEEINFSNNRIENLEIFSYPNRIHFAWFYNNNIVYIHNATNTLHLKQFGLGRNNIEEIDFLTSFLGVEELQLIDNHITDINPIGLLRNLIELRIDNNKIYDISPLENNEKLTSLEIEKNLIKDVSALGQLHSLTYINLRANKITNVEPLKELSNLEGLDLSYNDIKLFPFWITESAMTMKWEGDYASRKGINLYKNPIADVPIEILKKGTLSVSRYLQKILLDGQDFMYETKLILVGEGSGGKTSLQKRLINDKASLPKTDTRTRGIKISDWVFKKASKRKHIAHIWDFGGQDVYYPVHRFFITENSVFVLLASTRQTHHNFDYWIPTIYQFGGSSPVIIGQTCHDGNRVSWSDLGLYMSNSNFNIVKTQELPYYEINLPNQNDGLEKIKSVIKDQLINLPHYGKGIPRSWVQVRNLLGTISMKHPCISFEYFQEMCKTINEQIFNNYTDVSDCCQFLHDVGVVLWYSKNEELKNWVILQPEWAMNAVYKIIDDEKVQVRRGNIIADDFSRLWQDESYISKHSILKKMLEIFKIAFPKKHRNEDYIIPARLVSIPSENIWKNKASTLTLTYRYEFMPRGLVNQVSAELSRYITNEKEVWNNAVNLYLDNGRAECQVIENFYDRKITIKVSGVDSRALITLVMNSLQNINDGYKGVKTTVSVPCLCNYCKGSENASTFPYHKLLEWSLSKDFVVCNESNDKVIINELLYNVGLPSNTTNKQNTMKRTITLFLASSSELRADRENFEIFINRENKRLNNENVFIRLELWEDFIDALSASSLQDEYNKAIEDSDIFVSLFFTKVGKFTEEEFAKAYEKFRKAGRPLIYTYFKNAPVNSNDIKEEDIISKFRFEEKLRLLGHYPSVYTDIENLKSQFRSQLDKIMPKLIS